MSASISRRSIEYGGWSDVIGPNRDTRSICPAEKFDTPIQRTLPSFWSWAIAAQPSSRSSSGSGQCIWYRSMTSTFSRFRLASHSRRIESALRLWPIWRRSSQTMLHLVKT